MSRRNAWYQTEEIAPNIDSMPHPMDRCAIVPITRKGRTGAVTDHSLAAY